jgi:hypothetical protein
MAQSGFFDQSRAAELGGAEGAAIGGGRQRVRLRQVAHVQWAGRRLGVVSGSSASHPPGPISASRSRSGHPAAQRRRRTSPDTRRSPQKRSVFQHLISFSHYFHFIQIIIMTK